MAKHQRDAFQRGEILGEAERKGGEREVGLETGFVEDAERRAQLYRESRDPGAGREFGRKAWAVTPEERGRPPNVMVPHEVP